MLAVYLVDVRHFTATVLAPMQGKTPSVDFPKSFFNQESVKKFVKPKIISIPPTPPALCCIRTFDSLCALPRAFLPQCSTMLVSSTIQVMVQRSVPQEDFPVQLTQENHILLLLSYSQPHYPTSQHPCTIPISNHLYLFPCLSPRIGLFIAVVF